MSKKSYSLEGVGTVTVFKRKGAKTMRLRVSAENTVRVTVPYWVPFSAGLRFAASKKEWIAAQAPQQTIITHDSLIGKNHRVYISYVRSTDKVRARRRGEGIHVSLPLSTDIQSEDVQDLMRSACIRALRAEAKAVLPKRLEYLAHLHGFTYNKVSIKKMKSRWGSCTQQKNISLNLYLMQLDDDLIDYVLLHELLHTEILAHGKKFWSALADYVPELAACRKRMRSVEPRLLVR